MMYFHRSSEQIDRLPIELVRCVIDDACRRDDSCTELLSSVVIDVGKFSRTNWETPPDFDETESD
jgi:hypothetical protein